MLSMLSHPTPKLGAAHPPFQPLQTLMSHDIPVFAMYERNANSTGLTKGVWGLAFWLSSFWPCIFGRVPLHC